MSGTSTEDHERYLLATELALLVVADDLADREGNDDRAHRMDEVVAKKAAAMLEAWGPNTFHGLDGADAEPLDLRGVAGQALALASAELDEQERVELLVDVALADPFAPYEVKTDHKDFDEAFVKLATTVGFVRGTGEQVLEYRRAALKAHRSLNTRKVLLAGVIGTAVLGVTGFTAAPILGGLLGSAAGLSGAAATAHGLALLGGGTLAAGGAGMAGGLWVVAGTGAVLGGLAGGAGRALVELGAAQSRRELVNFQVSYRLNIIDGQVEDMKAHEVIAKLEQSRREVEEQLAEERHLNERNAARVKEIESVLDAIVAAQDDIRSLEAA